MSVRMKKKTRGRNIAFALFLTLVFVLGAGLEPARANAHRILSPACLPIPPSERGLTFLRDIFDPKGGLLKQNRTKVSFLSEKTHNCGFCFERETGFEPATPTLARSCSTN